MSDGVHLLQAYSIAFVQEELNALKRCNGARPPPGRASVWIAKAAMMKMRDFFIGIGIVICVN